MQLIIDTEQQSLTCSNGSGVQEFPLFSKEAFELISREWVRVGWNEKYAYTFSWMGRPVIQLPEDLVRSQEVIHRIQPDVIIETGVAHGGSLIFYASLCKAMNRGRVIGIDIEIRPHNRGAIEEHPLAELITLVEGNAVAPNIVQQVKQLVRPSETVLIFLDSCHTKDHVRAELEAYSPLVTPDSYIVATDGLMADLHDTPRGGADWLEDNPTEAAREFVAAHPDFEIEQPSWPFNESQLAKNITHWPSAWLKRTK
jgi:cephalosporin hydroxylase